MITNVDVVVGLAWGDEGKGKVTSHLTKTNDYDYVCRWAGGANAGHTVYVNDKEYKILQNHFVGTPINPINHQKEKLREVVGNYIVSICYYTIRTF